MKLTFSDFGYEPIMRLLNRLLNEKVLKVQKDQI